MPECGNIQGAYSAQDVNIGWYGYYMARQSALRIGPGDNFTILQTVHAGKRVGVQSARNPRKLDNPPRRKLVEDATGKKWTWVYLHENGEVGWIKAANIKPYDSEIPWAHGPRKRDFHIGMEPCRRDNATSCHGRRRNKIRILARRTKLRLSPGGTAFRYLQAGDEVRELYRRSLDDYSVVTVIRSDTTPEGTRGWVRVAALSAEKVTGIDVSSFQGQIDFEQVKASGERFVICKATEGEGFRDQEFLRNVAGARAAKLEVGAYHFLRPLRQRSGRDEADDFIRALRAASMGKGDIRPVVDVETTTLDVAATQIYVGQFVGSLRMAGFDAILYTYPAFMNWSRTFNTDLWIANYNVRRPTIPSPWEEYVIWQYTDQGTVPGVRGKVDQNKCPDLARIIQR